MQSLNSPLIAVGTGNLSPQTPRAKAAHTEPSTVLLSSAGLSMSSCTASCGSCTSAKA